MNNQLHRQRIVLVLLILVASGCGTAVVEPTFQPVNPTVSPTSTATQETATQTPEPTSTLEPALTPNPTPTQTPTIDEKQSNDMPNDDLAIREALAAHLGANVHDLTIVINQNNGTHARGGVENGYFIAVKIDGQWRIVADGQGALDCQALAQYDFPPSMLPECQSAGRVDQIKFKSGGTYTFVQEFIKAGENHSYTIQALAGQTIIASVASPHNDVWIGIGGIQDGQQLVSRDAHTDSWSGTLPQTQEYQITLYTDNPDTYYFLEVEIPVYIRFAPETYSTTIDGHIEVFDASPSASIDSHVMYLVHAAAGQAMDVKLASPNIDALSLGVYGQTDGQPYLRYQVKNSGFNRVLPLTQGYYLKVFSNGVSTDFTLIITIT